MRTKIHAATGILAFLIILTFWTSTVLAELFGSHETIALVKVTILRGMVLLIPALAIAGASGMAMGRKRTDAPARRKNMRMPFIAANGILILVPSALFLAGRASAGQFDAWFIGVQAIELLVGATNLALMGLNIHDGMRLTGRMRRSRRAMVPVRTRGA